MSRLVLAGILLALIASSAPPARADDAEERAVKLFEKHGGIVRRADKAPGKPVVELTLPEKLVAGDTSFSEGGATDADLKELASLRNLAALKLCATRVTDAGLKELSALPNLTTLTLACPRVTDAGLRELARAQKLTSLHLIGPRRGEFLSSPDITLTPAGMKEVAQFKNLADLSLSQCELTAEHVKALAPLKTLTSLDVSESHFAARDLKELAPLTNLTTLWVPRETREPGLIGSKYEPWVSDEALTALRAAKLLHALDRASAADGKRPTRPEDVIAFNLSYAQVSGAGLAQLADFTNLRNLSISDKWVTNEALAALARIGLLHALSRATAGENRPAKPEDVTGFDLSGTPVTDAGVKELRHFKNLTVLDVRDSKVTVTGLRELPFFRSLTELDLRYNRITAQEFTALAELKDLRCLNLNGTETTDDGLRALGQTKSLTALHLSGTKVTDAGLKGLRAHKRLTSLDLRSCAVTDVGLKELTAFPNLTHLNLRGTQVTDAAVKELQKELTKCEVSK